MDNAMPSRLHAPLACTIGAVGVSACFLLRRKARAGKSNMTAAGLAAVQPPPPPVVYVAEEPQDTISEEARRWVSVLVKAASVGESATVSDLLRGVPGDSPSDLLNVEGDLVNWPNVTAVCAACIFGQASTLQLLLDARADPNVRCQKATSWDGAFNLTNRETALCVAGHEGHLACVAALLQAGADPNIECESEYMEGAVEWGEDDDGTETHYYYAIDAANMGRHSEIAELITKHGGRKIVKSSAKPTRVRITQGSRMGA